MKTSVLPKTAGLAALTLMLGTLTLAAQGPGGNRPQRPADAPQIERIEREMERLKAEGRTEDARRMNQRLQQARGEVRRGQADRLGALDRADRPQPPDAKPGQEGPPPRVKIRNLRQAAALLEAAGYDGYADRVRSEAGRVAAEVQDMDERKKPQVRRGKMMREKAADEKQMRQPRSGPAAKPQPPAAKPEPPANPAIEAEVRKLRRDINEMRAEMRRMKAAGPAPERN